VESSNKYGRIYHEICNGFSKQLLNNDYIYFKHPTLSEHFSQYYNYELYLENGRKKGLLSEKEKIEQAIEGNWWSSENESNINFLKLTIDNLYKTKSKLILPSQKKEIHKDIKKNEAILLSYAKQRNEIVGYCLENYATKCLTGELLINFIYSDENFQNKIFKNKDEYDDLSENELNKIENYFNIYSSLFTIENLKCVAACGFFQNLVYLNEDAYSFWGKATTKCTKYQIDLILYGKMYKNFIKNRSENSKPVEEEILSDPEKFVQLVDNQYQNGQSSNIPKEKSSQNAVSSLVGASKEDLKTLGVKIEKLKGKSLLELARENGGILEKSEYLNARENN